MERIFVGVAWPYANGPFHIGHLAGAYLPGDTFARFHRLRGNEVLLVSGSDMHGTPTLVTAEKEGVTPSEVADRYHEVNKSAFERLGFSFDLYTHTHTPVHEKTVQALFLALLENGYVRRRTADGAYCPKHQRFLPDRYLVGTCPHCGFDQARGDECDHCGRPLEPRQLGSPRCVLCGTPAEFRPSEHFYLELDRLQPDLAEYVRRQSHWRPGTLRVAENFLAEGLRPTPITRDLDWGVPIPLDGYDSKRFYVWFDAVTGYLSASKEWAVRSGTPDAWRRFWDPSEPVRSYYFVGKDNKFHHTIIWPGMLLGAGGLKLPYDVPANEWLLTTGGKLSKSRTEDRDAFVPALLERYPPDVIRFYAALLAPQNHDTELDWDEFHKVREEILANQYGNLVQRTLVLVRDRYGGRIPPRPAEAERGERAKRRRTAHERITREYEQVHLKEALDLALAEVRETNRAFHEARPWNAGEPERTRAVCDALEAIQAIATWLAPVLPFSSAEVFRMLGYPAPPSKGDWDRALEPPPPGQTLGEVRPLFPRPGSGSAPRGSSASSASSGPETVAASPPVLSVRSGTIRSAVDHPTGDKLYVLEVDVGEAEPRVVVAGLRPSYSIEALRGRAVALLANLAPRTIRRVTSRGMVLAADHDERPVLIEPPPEVPPGTFVSGRGSSDREISYEEFAAIPLRIARAEAPVQDGRTQLSLGSQTLTAPGTWEAGSLVVVRTEGPGSAEVLSFGPGRPLRPAEPVPPGVRVR